MSRQVLPTAPSPTTTHLMVCIAEFSSLHNSFKIWNTEGKKSQAWNGMQNFSLHTVESCFSCLEVQEKLRGERTLSIFTPCTALQIFFHQKICCFYNVVFLLLKIFLTIYFNDFLKCLPLARSHLFKAPKAKLMYPLNTENSISNVKNRYSLKQKWIWTLKCELLQ